MSKLRTKHTFFMAEDWLMCRKELNATSKLVYFSLFRYGQGTGKFYASQQTLANDLGIGRDRINIHIQTLAKHGLIKIIRNGRNKNNNYEFLDHTWMYDPHPNAVHRAKANQTLHDSVQNEHGDVVETPHPDVGETPHPDVGETPHPDVGKPRQGIDKLNNISKTDKSLVHSEVHSDKKNTKASLSIVHSTSSSERVSENKCSDKFLEFWKAYPKKLNKKRARDYWVKKKRYKDFDKIMCDIEFRKQTVWKTIDPKFIPLGSSYLNDEPWLDDQEEIKSSMVNQKKNYTPAELVRKNMSELTQSFLDAGGEL